MTTYAIFNRKYDCEIWVNLKVGTLESIDTIRELIGYELDDNPSLERGYVESYPFFQADWEIVGGRMDSGFDYDQIQEVENDHGIFKEGKEMKQFECFWGDGYRDDEGKAILAYHNEDFFNEDRGYQSHDIEDIQNLKVGQSINLSCITGEHWVQRIK